MQPTEPLVSPSSDLLDRFEQLVGPSSALRHPTSMLPFLTEWRGRFAGQAAMILFPDTVAQISSILALAHQMRVGIVPQGGNTGLVGGQIPSSSGNQILLSLRQLNRILDVDPENNSLTAEAGCTLAQVQEAAAGVKRLFPLRLGPDKDSQIGGNLSTNAGGSNALSYGVARDMVIGLQAVLPDGRIFESLKKLRKDNTGYDLKQLFIGAEGTLGIITAAVLKLFHQPRTIATVYTALPNPTSALTLLHRVRDTFGQSLTSFELMPDLAIDFGLRHIPHAGFPFSKRSPWYVLAEIASDDTEKQTLARIDHLLLTLLQENLVCDATRAKSCHEAESFWKLRSGLSKAQKYEGRSIKHDISLPIGAIPSFLKEALRLLEPIIPQARHLPFGHLGDGNLHYNISQPSGMENAEFLEKAEQVYAIIYDLTIRYGGSISAEHGIGQLKISLLARTKSQVELEMMKCLKASFDPHGILNPGKLLP